MDLSTFNFLGNKVFSTLNFLQGGHQQPRCVFSICANGFWCFAGGGVRFDARRAAVNAGGGGGVKLERRISHAPNAQTRKPPMQAKSHCDLWAATLTELSFSQLNMRAPEYRSSGTRSLLQLPFEALLGLGERVYVKNCQNQGLVEKKYMSKPRAQTDLKA